MADLLMQEGFNVDYADYGTDHAGDLRASADNLQVGIREIVSSTSTLNPDGVEKLDIIAHSMGGLVTRAFMTNMHWSAIANPYNKEIRRLIMVGTPNYGTPLGAFGELLLTCSAGADIRDAQAEQMRYGSGFLWTLHNEWTKFVEPRPEVVDRILVVAGTGGPGWNDAVVNVSSAALTRGSTEAVRYVPYIHTGALRLIGTTTSRALVNIPPSTPDPCGDSDDPYCGDVGENHKTFRFLLPFLSTGSVPSQAQVWDGVPNFDEGILMMHVVDGHGPIPPEATRTLNLEFTPWAGLHVEHKNDAASAITATGLWADPEQTYTVTVKATGYLSSDVRDITIERARTTVADEVLLNPALAISISTSTLPQGEVGAYYSQTLQATGGAPPYTWRSIWGKLPKGLTLDAVAGTISGTPAKAKTAAFTVQVTDASYALATQNLTLQIIKGVKLKTKKLSRGTVGLPYSATLKTKGGTPPLAFSLVGGTLLPSGLTLDSATGQISGTPAMAGTFDFVVQVTSSGGSTHQKQLRIKIK
jgi:hypothetical protein